MNEYLLTYYGDDFTGSADVMEALVLGGIPTVLFLEPPQPEFVQTYFPGIRAIGVAGISRTMTPAQMNVDLPPIFMALKAFGAPLIHYKICSTFDSSPTTGSIGQAIELGRALLPESIVPLVVGAPALKRYVTFGNLFATAGGQTYRLDRHPTMSRHPITPMDESDLRVHLAKQTKGRIGLINILQLAQPQADLQRDYQALIDQGCEIILFDTIDHCHLRTIGKLIWEHHGQGPTFLVGSSGIEYALTYHWLDAGIVRENITLKPPASVDQLIVMCGSASPTTKSQIEWALDNGYSGIRLNSARLIDPVQSAAACAESIRAALNALGQGQSIVLYAALGPDDPAIAQSQELAKQLAIQPQSVGAMLGQQQGMILRAILEETGLRRACIAGGDTSGYVAQQLEIVALEILNPIAPGAPLCRATSRLPQFKRLEIAFKGGQNGKEDYFEAIRMGYAG